MNADDVVYTLSRHMGEDTKSIGKSQFDMVTSVKKVNEYEVECNLETPNADLVNSLGTFHFRVVQDGVEDFSTAIGTGPYRCKEFKPGVRTVGTHHLRIAGMGQVILMKWSILVLVILLQDLMHLWLGTLT